MLKRATGLLQTAIGDQRVQMICYKSQSKRAAEYATKGWWGEEREKGRNR